MLACGHYRRFTLTHSHLNEDCLSFSLNPLEDSTRFARSSKYSFKNLKNSPREKEKKCVLLVVKW